MSRELTHFILGEAVRAELTAESRNPSNTDDIVARVPCGGTAEVDAAAKAARAAFPAWADASPEARSDLLDKVGAAIWARADELGQLLSREEGKTLAEGIGEVRRAARIFRYFAGEALRRHGQSLESVRPGIDVTTHREAVGVVGLITPWNFPIAIPAWKAAPALAFGNTVVLKPATPTPAIAHALAAIIHEADAPSGVFNLVLGEGGVGKAIVDHPEVDAISFTGSQAVGTQVAEGTVRRKRGRGSILVDSGALRGSLTQAGHPEQIVELGRDSLLYGTRVPYARFHQRGTRRMPARPPLVIRAVERANFAKRLRAYIVTGDATGFRMRDR